MKRTHVYSCDCGHSGQFYVDQNYDVTCTKCGSLMWVNFSFARVSVDTEAKMERRRINRLRKVEDISTSDVEHVQKHNERIKERKYQSSKEALIEKTVRSAEFLSRNQEVSKQISAEIRNTGKSAMAKKISEVV